MSAEHLMALSATSLFANVGVTNPTKSINIGVFTFYKLCINFLTLRFKVKFYS